MPLNSEKSAGAGPVVYVKNIESPARARRELEKIAVDPESLAIMAPKFRHIVLKVKGLDVRAANVLKQEMLSKGAEAAVAKWSSGFSKPVTDVLLSGTLKQYRLVLKKMRVQPFGLRALVGPVERALLNADPHSTTLECGPHKLEAGRRTLVMGILNLTPDSFSDGGSFSDLESAVARAREMVEAGADIIDVGGESTRPGAPAIGVEEELSRVMPVLERLSGELAAAVSIDTSKAAVAGAAIGAGAAIVNDVTALRGDSEMAGVCAEAKVGVILMHMLGDPRTMQKTPEYGDLMSDLAGFFQERVEFAAAAGIAPGRIMIDPGFGFGKTVRHNLEIIKRIGELSSLGFPVVLGASRKATIGEVLGDAPPSDRLEGTAAAVTAGILGGAAIVRVHDVREMSRVAKMTDAIKKGVDWDG